MGLNDAGFRANGLQYVTDISVPDDADYVWQHSEGSGLTLSDSESTADGDITNPSWATTPSGKNYLDYSATNSYTTLTDTKSTLNFPLNTATLTIGAWVRDNANSDKPIFGCDDTSNGDAWRLNNTEFVVCGTNASSNQTVFGCNWSQSDYTTGAWQPFVGHADGTDALMYIGTNLSQVATDSVDTSELRDDTLAYDHQFARHPSDGGVANIDVGQCFISENFIAKNDLQNWVDRTKSYYGY